MKKWEILDGKFKVQSHKFKIDDLVWVLLKNRKINTKKEIEEFLNPELEDLTIENVGIDKKELKRAIHRIKDAIKKGEGIVVFGDYDVDGICGAAILWETLNGMGAKVLPYIPHRIDEGYGLSVTGIVNLLTQIPNTKLIITVDNGIVANEPVDFAKKQGIDVIVTDHHVPAKLPPKAHSIVHTTKLCGAAVGYMLSRELTGSKAHNNEHLALAALASVADLVPLIGPSRIITKYGIEAMRKTKRVGLLALFSQVRIENSQVGTYEIGHMIAPRINAMGRMESAMDSLRLLCTKDKNRAKLLAHKLSSTNTERQKATEEAILHAKSLVNKEFAKHLIFISHESYQQGVIGLVASKLVEEYYVPSIVISRGEQYSKASARSVSGFNIIEFIRSASKFLVDAGGHPMAAGFTVETAKLELLQKKLIDLASKQVKKELLTQVLRVDCELPLDLISFELYEAIAKLSPFGMGNPMPTFVSSGKIEDMKVVGNGAKHLKLKISGLPAIWFRGGEKASELHIGDKVDLVYTIDKDLWNGNRKIQLKLKDVKN
jgi:single-stranded-DNA-specific exonuclease